MSIFFTEKDDGVFNENKRDPLGFQPIWSYFGSKVINNLTTVSDDFRGFREALLCLDLVNDYCHIRKNGDRRNLKSYVLAFEQLFMYSIIEHDKDNKYEKVLGSDNWKKKKPKVLSVRNTILSNQINLGYYGRYKTPLYNMKILNDESDIEQEIKKEIPDLYGDSYEKIKEGIFDFFEKLEVKSFELPYNKFQPVLEMQNAICGNLREGEYEFWKTKLNVTDEYPIVKAFYESEDEDPQTLIESIYNKTSDTELSEIISMEYYMLCIERVFYLMLNCESIDKVREKLGDIENHRKRYNNIKDIKMNDVSNSLRCRFEELKKCNPYEEDYIYNIYEYHKVVSEQKRKDKWLDVNDGCIQGFGNIGEVDINRWNRGYYIYSLKSIKKKLEELRYQNGKVKR